MAIDFDGTGDYINSSYDPVWSTSQSWTIAFWLNTTIAPETYGDFVSVVAEKGANDPGVIIQCLNTKVQILVRDADGSSTGWKLGTTTINDGAWHHAALVRDVSADKILLYVDGGNAEVDVADPTTGNIDLSGYPFFIGARNDRGTAGAEIAATIDEVSMCNAAWSQGEIQMAYDAGLKMLPLLIGGSNLECYWPFDELCAGTAVPATGGYVKDLSGNDNHGTKAGDPYYAEGCLAYPAGPVYVHIPAIGDVTVYPGAQALALGEQTPTVGVKVLVASAALALTQQTPTAAVTTLLAALGLSLTQETATPRATLLPSAQGLSLGQQTPVPEVRKAVSEALALVLTQPAITSAVTLLAAAQALGLTQHTPMVLADRIVQLAALALSIAQQTPSLSIEGIIEYLLDMGEEDLWI